MARLDAYFHERIDLEAALVPDAQRPGLQSFFGSFESFRRPKGR
jgi:hypothetical protein